MGLRGPKPDPSRPNSRTKSGGNRRVGSTAYNAAQVRKLEAGEPAKPSYLTGRASDIWDETVSLLVKAKLIAEVDMHTLGAYCLDMATFVDLSIELKNARVETSSKKKKEYNEAQLKAMREEANQAWGRAKQVGDSLGMSSKSRTGMGITSAAPGDNAVARGGGGVDGGSKLAFVLTGKR